MQLQSESTPVRVDQSLQRLRVDNVSDKETVHQRCLLIRGHSPAFATFSDFLKVTVKDLMGNVGPEQTWPMAQGRFSALVMLSSGDNLVTLQRYNGSDAQASTTITLNYVPLGQIPPLHLAIMIAKDSPLTIDCPVYKGAGLSSAHSGLDAAIAKFRTTAYMWQALTAEDMYGKGLGRRSFRLEEEWAVDTTTRTSLNRSYSRDARSKMCSTAKVHLVRSDKTVAELLDAQVAQQNPNASRADDLHKYFSDALKARGGVFDSSARPVVAGMILDSHYSTEQSLLLGHAALGAHDPNGLSLGMFGSHLAYSWPRYLEEVSSCLTDTTPPGDSVCNDNHECETSWEACSIGQGAFLHEVGHAFGAPHSSGIMQRGYAQYWPRNFLAQTAYCEAAKSDGVVVIPGETPNEARWDLKDALAFRCLPHFRVPGDPQMTSSFANASPSVKPVIEEDGSEINSLVVECTAGIVSIDFPGPNQSSIRPPVSNNFKGPTQHRIDLTKFDNVAPVPMTVLGGNGKELKVKNIFKYAAQADYIRIPNSDIRLKKQSISISKEDRMVEDEDGNQDDSDENEPVEWTVLLRERGKEGKLWRATQLDVHVGAVLDGAVVAYEDGHKTNCGPQLRAHGDHMHAFGGNSYKLNIPAGEEVIRVEVCSSSDASGRGGGFTDWPLGLRVTLSSGETVGEVKSWGNSRIDVLEPLAGERIVGFYGRSDGNNSWVVQFGILTAPKGVELPELVYDMEELQNKDSRAAW